MIWTLLISLLILCILFLVSAVISRVIPPPSYRMAEMVVIPIRKGVNVANINFAEPPTFSAHLIFGLDEKGQFFIAQGPHWTMLTKEERAKVISIWRALKLPFDNQYFQDMSRSWIETIKPQ